ncbi:hypothetical protein DFH28DRAFT_903056, partial [Melampsora americana]
ISGHFFQVEGASLRDTWASHAKTSKTLGRWTSFCYKQYSREYSSHELQETLTILYILGNGLLT